MLLRNELIAKEIGHHKKLFKFDKSSEYLLAWQNFFIFKFNRQGEPIFIFHKQQVYQLTVMSDAHFPPQNWN